MATWYSHNPVNFATWQSHDPSLPGTGPAPVYANASAPLGVLSAGATGSVTAPVSATGTTTLSPLTGQGSGSAIAPVDGGVAHAVPPLGAAANGTVAPAISGTASPILALLSASASATTSPAVSAVASDTLGPLAASAALFFNPLQGSASAALGHRVQRLSKIPNLMTGGADGQPFSSTALFEFGVADIETSGNYGFAPATGMPNYTALLFGWQITHTAAGVHRAEIIRFGVPVGSPISWSAGDRFGAQMVNTGTTQTVYYYHNGVQRPTTTSATLVEPNWEPATYILAAGAQLVDARLDGLPVVWGTLENTRLDTILKHGLNGSALAQAITPVSGTANPPLGALLASASGAVNLASISGSANASLGQVIQTVSAGDWGNGGADGPALVGNGTFEFADVSTSWSHHVTGLGSSRTGYNHWDTQYGWWIENSGTINRAFVIESGSAGSANRLWVAGDHFRVQRVTNAGTPEIRYYHNADLVRTVTVGVGTADLIPLVTTMMRLSKISHGRLNGSPIRWQNPNNATISNGPDQALSVVASGQVSAPIVATANASLILDSVASGTAIFLMDGQAHGNLAPLRANASASQTAPLQGIADATLATPIMQAAGGVIPVLSGHATATPSLPRGQAIVEVIAIRRVPHRTVQVWPETHDVAPPPEPHGSAPLPETHTLVIT